MKKIYALGLSLILIALLASTVSADGVYVKWQIGTPDDDVRPRDGAMEYTATRSFYPEYNYTIGQDVDPILAPNFPGYIGPQNVCDISERPTCTDTAQVVNINFDLACDYSDGGLTFHFDRYGSETDNLYLDGEKFATIFWDEGGFSHFTFDLAAAAGNHTITIEYQSSGRMNGHYIDFLQLLTDVDDTKCEKIKVDIDIKPGSFPSCFNNDGRGVIPVAIFGSADFKVRKIDTATLELEGLPVSTRPNGGLRVAYEDWNNDGYLDLLVKFKDIDGVFFPGDEWATVTGMLKNGITPFEGVGDICITQ